MRPVKTGVLPKRTKAQKLPVRQNEIRRSSKYNKTIMKDDTIQVYQGFAKRLASVRAAKGLSAREMSLSLGQGAGYINNIENGRNLPSMSMFFEICEYLELSPDEFFDYTARREGSAQQMLTAFKQLGPEEQDLIITIAKKLRRG